MSGIKWIQGWDRQRWLEILPGAPPNTALPAPGKHKVGTHMHLIVLDSETDFDGWRKAARTLVLNDVKPSDVTWTARGNEPELFEPSAPSLETPQGSFNVSAKFV